MTGNIMLRPGYTEQNLTNQKKINDELNSAESSINQGTDKEKTNNFVVKFFHFIEKVFLSAPYAIRYPVYWAGYKTGCAEKLTLQKLSFAITAPFRANDYNKIEYTKAFPRYGNLYLGALPVHNQGMFKNLKTYLGIGDLVVSVNEPWEREPQINSNPVTEKNWGDKRINYEAFDAFDHQLIENEKLYKIANTVKTALEKGQNVYIHCRAGRGRSAMVLAAALILMECSADKAAKIILKSRPSSTIIKKLGEESDGSGQKGLYAFAKYALEQRELAETLSPLT